MIFLRRLSLTLAALLALAAVTASTAAAIQLQSETATTYLTGTEGVQNGFTLGGSSYTCPGTKIRGTTTAKSTSQAQMNVKLADPSNCLKNFTTGTDVVFNGCEYVITVDEGSAPTASGKLHIKCVPATDRITFTPTVAKAPLCTVKIGPQTVGKINYTNEGVGANRDITLNWSIEGLTHEVEKDSGKLCGGNGVHNNGKLFGTMTLRGYKDLIHSEGEQTGIFVE